MVMLTERQKKVARKQNEERHKNFVASLNAEEKKKRDKYIAARDKADKMFNDFFQGKVSSVELDKAEKEKDRCQKAFFELVINNRQKEKKIAAKKAKNSAAGKQSKTTAKKSGVKNGGKKRK